MSFNHAVIWIDHEEAHVIQFNPEQSASETIRTHSRHQHGKRGTVTGARVALDQSFLHEVIAAVADVKEILIVGPGSAKLELVKHATRHDAKVADRIVGVETVDHPSDGQLLAHAKKTFARVDNLKGDSRF